MLELRIDDLEFEAAPSPYCDPTYSAPVLTVDEARDAVKVRVGEFFGMLVEYSTEAARCERAVEAGEEGVSLPQPPAMAINVGTGIGKSRDARVRAAEIIKGAHGGLAAMKRQRVELLKEIRARRRAGEQVETPPVDKDLRSALRRLRRGIFSVPRHNLGDETADVFRKLGLTATVYRGRAADAPNQKHVPEGDREKMCLDQDAVNDAMRSGANVSEACCYKADRETGDVYRCPFFDQCKYQQMLAEAKAADTLIIPHEVMFGSIPSSIGRFGLVVADEAFWQKGLKGVDGEPIKLTVDTLTEECPEIFNEEGDRDDFATNDLVAARAKLAKAMRAAKDGPLNRRHLIEAGLTVAECGDAKKLEWRRITRPNIVPGMDPLERKDEADRTEHSGKRVRLVARLWSCVADLLSAEEPELLSGNLIIGKTDGPAGPARSVTLRWRDDLSTRVTDLPILHLDATMRAPLVRAYLPHVEIMDEVQATMPFVTVRQVYDKPFSGHMLITQGVEYKSDEYLDPDEVERLRKRRDSDNKTRVNHAQRVLWYIRQRALEFRGMGGLYDEGGENEKQIDVLVICQQGLEHLLPTVGQVPPGVEIAHYNDVAGSNRWEKVACIIMVGRPLPSPGSVEAMCGALTGIHPASCQPSEKGRVWYDKVEQGIRLADGRGLKIDGAQHPDPMAEDIRWSICEGQVIQGIGRPRGVNRTEADPLQIDILTNLCLPVTVDEAVEWKDVAPTEFDEMRSRGAVLENSADMHKAFDDLWVSPKAARHAKERTAPKPLYMSSYKGNGAVLSQVTYQPAGPGQKPRTGWFDLSAIPDPAAWLTEKVGKLARCEIQEIEADPIRETDEPAGAEPPAVEGIDPMEAQARLTALSARLDAANPIIRAIDALADLSARLEDAKPSAEILPLGALPGFGPTKRTDVPTEACNGGCSDDTEEVYVGFDWGNDPFARFRQTPDLLRKPTPGTDMEGAA
jgi:putative DNA primase/helicase